MKVRSLVINNFMSFYGCHKIDLADKGLVFVKGVNLDEPKSPANGAGKSSMVDALDWGLFGENPRGDVAKSIINDEAKKDCWVLVELEDQDGFYVVFRYRQIDKENGVHFYLLSKNKTPPLNIQKWQNLTRLDADKTQLEINKQIGLDHTVFKAAVYRSQNDPFSFAEASDGERKELLTALIPELQEVDSLKEKAKHKSIELQTLKALLEGGVNQAQNELSSLKLINWLVAEDEWYVNRANRLIEAEQQFASLLKLYQDNEEAMNTLPSLKDHLCFLEKNPFIPQQYWSKQVQLRTVACNQYQTEVSSLQFQYKALTKELDSFLKGEVSGKCPKCNQAITAEHVQKEILRIKAEIAPIVEAGKVARAHLNNYGASLQEAMEKSSAEQKLNQAENVKYIQELSNTKSKIDSLEKINKQNLTLAINLDAWKNQCNNIVYEVWPGEGQKKQKAERIQFLESQILEATDRITATIKEVNLYEFWVNALTAKGLKSLILDSRIEDMTTAANTWVQAVTGGSTWVRFETQSMNQSGKLSEKLNIRIFRHNPDGSITERNFKSWSGGEKTRVALGADQGLAKLIADRATKSWELRILDESFSRGLDGGGREAIFEQIQKISEGTVLVIDHSDISNFFENTWTVQIQNRRSQVLVKGVSCLIQGKSYKEFLPVVH